ncbi:MAG: phosphotransferase [Verrucomicrobia bacterium]|nr:phosphotransferase [Verrucomicrobiota bacterium]MBV9672576.1 phosphotransferase [Verrucomicrobiota bacterium]
MSLDIFISQTRRFFPHLHGAEVDVSPLEKGGSNRHYYRIRVGVDDSLILVKYDTTKAENRRFVSIAQFLNRFGVKAPLVYHHDPEQGLIWLQDLGDLDLWHFRNADWATRQTLYQATLDEVIRLHNISPSKTLNLDLQPGFDSKLYRWEQNYCMENCFGAFFGIDSKRLSALSKHPAFTRLIECLEKYPRVLIHRDFQSQNIIVWQEKAYLIDFQGMRLGLAQYDLASMLFDPYVSLPGDERDRLLKYYHFQNDVSSSFEEFEWVYLQCGLQRLMQALGAYGVIGLFRNKPGFLIHIQPAIKTLIEVASYLEDFNFFADFLAGLPERPNK